MRFPDPGVLTIPQRCPVLWVAHMNRQCIEIADICPHHGVTRVRPRPRLRNGKLQYAMACVQLDAADVMYLTIFRSSLAGLGAAAVAER